MKGRADVWLWLFHHQRCGVRNNRGKLIRLFRVEALDVRSGTGESIQSRIGEKSPFVEEQVGLNHSV